MTPPMTELADSLKVQVGKKRKELTMDEVEAKVGKENLVRVKFIPEMLTNLVMERALAFCDHCRDRRLHYYHKITRLLKEACKEYQRLQRAEYEKRHGYGVWPYYEWGYGNFRRAIDPELRRMHRDFTERARLQLGNKYYDDFETPALVSEMALLIRFVKAYDKEMEKMMTEALGVECRRRANRYVEIVEAMCLALGEDYNVMLDVDEGMARWIRTLSAKAYDVSSDLIRERGDWAKSLADVDKMNK